MNAIQLALVNNHTQIDPQDYLLSIQETVPVRVVTLLDDWFHKNPKKRAKTPEDLRLTYGWSPTGIEPETNYTWDDLLLRVEQNPDKPFNLHGCRVPIDSVYVFPKFNRLPEPSVCQKNLNTNTLGAGLSYQGLGAPQFFLVKIDGEIVLISVAAGHRTIKCAFQFGYDGFIPGANVVYVGSLDLEAPMPLASATHHQDCSKRNNQSANQRITSGVEAEDPKYVEQFQWMIDRGLYFDKTKVSDRVTSNMRQIGAPDSLNRARKNVENDSSWDVVIGWFKEIVPPEETLLVNSLEPVTIVYDTFNEAIQKKSNGTNLFKEFIQGQLSFCSQKHFRVQNNNKKYTAHQNAWKIIEDFNEWCKNTRGFNYKVISGRHVKSTRFAEFWND